MTLCRGNSLSLALAAALAATSLTTTTTTTTTLFANAQDTTAAPSLPPTPPPTDEPTPPPTDEPTPAPTDEPTASPTPSPSESPTSNPTILIGCPPLWSAGPQGSIEPSDIVSHPEEGTIEPALGVFECKPFPYSLYCPQSGFEPGTTHADAAWIRLGKCNSDVPFVAPTGAPTGVPTLGPTLSLWDSVGCPEETFVEGAGASIVMGDVVELDGIVYECVAEASGRCGQAGWEPGSGSMWEEAWVALGRCEGTIAPTPAVTLFPLWEKEGCPPEYDAAETYAEGDVASSSNGVVSECKPAPMDGFCNQFAPDAVPGGDLGWETLGSCVGTLTPTSMPSKNPTSTPTATPTRPLWDKEGCPPEFDASLATSYETGDAVELDDEVYECIATTAARCNQAGWEPGTGELWEEAWSVLGRCEGTIVPTGAPSPEILPLWEDIGCPERWVANTMYEGGDFVSVGEEPFERVFECKPFPDNGFCGMFEPEQENGELGWTLVDGCTGTLVPTSMPTTVAPTAAPTVPVTDFSGCAAPAYDAGARYEEGDQVRADGVIFECKAFPFALWCNNPGYAPGTDVGAAAWTEIGPC